MKLERTDKVGGETDKVGGDKVISKPKRKLTITHEYFGSNACRPLNKLSNFNRAPITIDDETVVGKRNAFKILQKVNPLFPFGYKKVSFLTTEHAWQSLKAKDKKTFDMFLISGILSKDAGFEFIFGDESAKKKRYWLAKGNWGILAKMAVNKRRSKKLGLNIEYSREILYQSIEKQVWYTLLISKFQQNPEHMKALMGTGDKIMVEFSRTHESHWGGVIVSLFGVTNWSVAGENRMGQYITTIRDSLK